MTANVSWKPAKTSDGTPLPRARLDVSTSVRPCSPNRSKRVSEDPADVVAERTE